MKSKQLSKRNSDTIKGSMQHAGNQDLINELTLDDKKSQKGTNQAANLKSLQLNA